jgi:hypothetical protein
LHREDLFADWTLALGGEEPFRIAPSNKRTVVLFAGKPQKLVELCAQRHTRYVRGVQAARRLFAQAA